MFAKMMREPRLGRRGVLQWGGLLGALAAIRPTAPVLAAGREQAGLAGAWLVTVTYTTAGDDARGLASFFDDGNFIGSVTAFEGPPARPTPSRGTTLHGVWRAAGHRAYTVRATRLHLDQQGVLLGTMQTRIALSLDAGGDAWRGTFTFDAIALDGTVTRSGHGTLRGTRVGAD
ncbi:MAG TPA: hypothetical protein VFW96_00035 [Thermomicrobiales bacterium]|nr:hypothetical protein [Thermomicrobiales bacterium]